MTKNHSRNFIRLASMALAACCLGFTPAAGTEERTPNFVIINVDDMGYGDLGAYGSPTIATPHLDRLAAEGQKWTNFYAPASVCTPSRAGLLTGRLAVRSGTATGVFFPYSAGGLPQEEVTIAELLKPAGYATAIVGKWHLGHLPQHLPTTQGFDHYYGIPYSNDMDGDKPYKEIMYEEPNSTWRNFNVPILRDTEEIERPADQRTLTRRYTEEAVRFIEEEADGPFLLYLAHSLPHVPLFAGKDFLGTSRGGFYGDVVEELDWSVGEVVAALDAAGVRENTLLVFTSDNGPWLTMMDHGGSEGPFYEGKGTTWEGGMRVPAIFSMPGHVQPGVVFDMGSALDFLPTVAAMAGVALPEDRVLDGYDLSSVLLGDDDDPRETLFYYRNDELYAVRHGRYKAHFITEGRWGDTDNPRIVRDTPLLFDLEADPGERFDIAADHPEVVADIIAIAEEHKAGVVPVPSQMTARIEGM